MGFLRHLFDLYIFLFSKYHLNSEEFKVTDWEWVKKININILLTCIFSSYILANIWSIYSTWSRPCVA